jgi:hypothetical protein
MPNKKINWNKVIVIVPAICGFLTIIIGIIIIFVMFFSVDRVSETNIGDSFETFKNSTVIDSDNLKALQP